MTDGQIQNNNKAMPKSIGNRILTITEACVNNSSC